LRYQETAGAVKHFLQSKIRGVKLASGNTQTIIDVATSDGGKENIQEGISQAAALALFCD
jgi:hypothetical protein